MNKEEKNKMVYNVPVCLVKEEKGYSIFIPGIESSCCEQGETKEKALKNMKKLLKFYFEDISKQDLDALKHTSVETIKIEK